MSVLPVLRCFVLLPLLSSLVTANVPKFVEDSKMALVLVPWGEPINTTIYRVKATDSDRDYPLTFSVPDTVGRTLLSIRPYPCGPRSDFCAADMVLNRALEAGLTSTFRLRVRDTTGEVTTVRAKVKATRGISRVEDTFTEMQSPSKGVITAGEDTKIGTVLATISAKRSVRNIDFDLRGTDKLVLRNSILTKNGAAVEIVLNGTLDYETNNLIAFSVFAENGYRNMTIDTRNVVEKKMLLKVQDVQDTPPYFTSAPAVLRVGNTAKPGDTIGTFRAVDGDRQNPRDIRYRLVPNGQGYDTYFSMDAESGNLSVTSSLTDLLTSPLEPMLVTVAAEEVTRAVADRAQSVQRDVAILRDNSVHQPPQFRQRLYQTQLFENPALGTLLNFEPPLETTGQRGSFALSIIGDLASRCFEVEPSIQTSEGQFYIRVKNNQLLDFEKLPQPNIIFRVKAEEVDLNGRTGRLLTSFANISVTMLDQNDNPPAFEKRLYRATFKENIDSSTSILKVTATDADQSDAGQVTYIRLAGDNANDLTLDPSSGDISIKTKLHDFDFEKQEEYQLTVYAVDSGRPQRTGTASIVLTVQDYNDHQPVFSQKLYNGKLNPNGASFEKPIVVSAQDLDSGSNGKIRYRLTGGGKWLNNFAIDRNTGELRVKKPVSMDLKDSADRGSRDFPLSEPLAFEKSGNDRVDDRIELEVEAQDEGEPQLFSKVPVHIYRKDNVDTVMTFLVKQDVQRVRNNKADVERQLSAFTGGTAQITSIEPYNKDAPLTGRNGEQLESSEGKTVITARVTRPYGAIFDTTGLEGDGTDGGDTGGDDGGPVVQATINNVWFWLLICLALLILLLIIIGCCCYNCAFCYTCCPLLSCYKRKQRKEYDEEGVAYIGIDEGQRVRSQGGRSGRVMHQMRRAMSGNAQRVRSATNHAWQGNGEYRHLPGGRRNSHSSTLRLMEAPADEPGRDHVILARQEMEDEVSRVMQNAHGARDSQIILVPNEIGTLHRTNSRASRGGPKMYRVMRGDGRGLPVRLQDGEEGYQLEDLEDEELQRLEMERQSVIMPNSRRSPSVEVLTLNEHNSGRDAEYRHHGNSESLRLHTSARPRRKEYYIDKDGNQIERPLYRGRPRDDSDVQYGLDPRLSGRARPVDRRQRTRSEVLVLHEEDGEEEGEEGDGRAVDDGGGGKAMIMKRFINSQEGGRLEETDRLDESELQYQQADRSGAPVTSQRRTGDVIEAETRVSARAMRTPIQEETQSVMEREDRETPLPAAHTPDTLYAQTKASLLRRRSSKIALHGQLVDSGLLHMHGGRRPTDHGRRWAVGKERRSEQRRRRSYPSTVVTQRGPVHLLYGSKPRYAKSVQERRRRAAEGPSSELAVSRQYRRQRSRSQEPERRPGVTEPLGRRRSTDEGEPPRHDGPAVPLPGRLTDSRPGSQISLQFSSNMLNNSRQQRVGSAGSQGRQRRERTRTDSLERRYDRREEDRARGRQREGSASSRWRQRENRDDSVGSHGRKKRNWEEERGRNDSLDRRDHRRENRREESREDFEERRRDGNDRRRDEEYRRGDDRNMINGDYRRSDGEHRSGGYDRRNNREFRERDDDRRSDHEEMRRDGNDGRRDREDRKRDGNDGRNDREDGRRDGNDRWSDRELRERHDTERRSDQGDKREDGKDRRKDQELRGREDRDRRSDREDMGKDMSDRRDSGEDRKGEYYRKENDKARKAEEEQRRSDRKNIRNDENRLESSKGRRDRGNEQIHDENMQKDFEDRRQHEDIGKSMNSENKRGEYKHRDGKDRRSDESRKSSDKNYIAGEVDRRRSDGDRRGSDDGRMLSGADDLNSGEAKRIDDSSMKRNDNNGRNYDEDDVKKEKGDSRRDNSDRGHSDEKKDRRSSGKRGEQHERSDDRNNSVESNAVRTPGDSNRRRGSDEEKRRDSDVGRRGSDKEEDRGRSRRSDDTESSGSGRKSINPSGNSRRDKESAHSGDNYSASEAVSDESGSKSRRGSDEKRGNKYAGSNGESTSGQNGEHPLQSHSGGLSKSDEAKQDASKKPGKNDAGKQRSGSLEVDGKSVNQKSKDKNPVTKQKSLDAKAKDTGKSKENVGSEEDDTTKQEGNKTNNKSSLEVTAETKTSNRDRNVTSDKKSGKDSKNTNDPKANKNVNDGKSNKTSTSNSKASKENKDSKGSKDNKDSKNKAEQAVSSRKPSNASNNSSDHPSQANPSDTSATVPPNPVPAANEEHHNDATYRQSDISDVNRHQSDINEVNRRQSDINGVTRHKSDISDGISGDSGFGDAAGRPAVGEDPALEARRSVPPPDDTGSNISSTLVPGVRKKRNQFLEKKSIFTIAYDDVHTHRLRSDTPYEADV